MENGPHSGEIFRKGALEDLAQEFADVYMAEKKANSEPFDPEAVEDDIMNKLIELEAAGKDQDEMIYALVETLYPNNKAKQRSILQGFMARTKHPKGAGSEFDLPNS